jgi:hypothetical protein
MKNPLLVTTPTTEKKPDYRQAPTTAKIKV